MPEPGVIDTEQVPPLRVQVSEPTPAIVILTDPLGVEAELTGPVSVTVAVHTEAWFTNTLVQPTLVIVGRAVTGTEAEAEEGGLPWDDMHPVLEWAVAVNVLVVIVAGAVIVKLIVIVSPGSRLFSGLNKIR